MIWSAGRVMADEELAINVLDRTFEHGLGLFETLRTWCGRAPLLARHCERLSDSARALGLPLEPRQLPTEEDVANICEAVSFEGDALLRIVLTGGRTCTDGSVLWMRVEPLPPPVSASGVSVGQPVRVDLCPELARHKTLNYWSRRRARERAESSGHFDALVADSHGYVWETTRANIFGVTSGSLVTPPLDGPVLPGIMRRVVIERAAAVGLAVYEVRLTFEELDEGFLTNSVRGVIPIRSLAGRPLEAPGPVTARLRANVDSWLAQRRDPR
jgi:branched-subunit amino acid aminotransferase/4-amino-4-deoxychorismate lyase